MIERGILWRINEFYSPQLEMRCLTKADRDEKGFKSIEMSHLISYMTLYFSAVVSSGLTLAFEILYGTSFLKNFISSFKLKLC